MFPRRSHTNLPTNNRAKPDRHTRAGTLVCRAHRRLTRTPQPKENSPRKPPARNSTPLYSVTAPHVQPVPKPIPEKPSQDRSHHPAQPTRETKEGQLCPLSVIRQEARHQPNKQTKGRENVAINMHCGPISRRGEGRGEGRLPP